MTVNNLFLSLTGDYLRWSIGYDSYSCLIYFVDTISGKLLRVLHRFQYIEERVDGSLVECSCESCRWRFGCSQRNLVTVASHTVMTLVLSSFASPAVEVMLNAVCFCAIICDFLQLRQGETKKYAQRVLTPSLEKKPGWNLPRPSSAATATSPISHSLASSWQGGAGNAKLLNSTLELHDFSANSLDSQMHVGIIPCLVIPFSFVRTHEGISVTEPVKKLIVVT